jgi:hypothetical protein
VPNVTTVIIGSGGVSGYLSSDTIFISTPVKSQLNDTLRKYLRNISATVKSVLIAQPSTIIDSIDFVRFPSMEELTFAGNDDDILENRKYNFMDNRSLKRINLYAVFVKNSDEKSDEEVFYSKKEMRKFIHTYRPDIRVRWPNKFNDRILWR